MDRSQSEYLNAVHSATQTQPADLSAHLSIYQDTEKSAVMKRSRFSCLTLNQLILLLAFAAASLTLLNSFYASYQVQKQQLIQHSLDSNYAYATKLASTTNGFLGSAQQQLAYAAAEIQHRVADTGYLLQQADRLRLQTDSFNSVVVADAQGIVLATSPNTLEIMGDQLTSEGAIEALNRREPVISKPYISATNRLLVFISHPLFDRQGRYLGYIGGSLYLKERSILNELLGTHYYKDGSYLYVVDQNKRIIYHPDIARVGDIVEGNQVIERVLAGNEGALKVVNSQQIEMLAGFSPIRIAQWGVVAQRPVEATLASLNGLMAEVFYRSLPMALLTFFGIWFLSRLIARPLKQLADTARTLDHPETPANLAGIRSWYFESSELKQAMRKGVALLQQQIGQLKHAASTDPLTGVFNRRSLDLYLDHFEQQHRMFTVLALDIDHFKQVNDTYGHSVGDKALVALSRKLSETSREQDVVARTGGEEFVLVLPDTSQEQGYEIAERLRLRIAEMAVESVGSIQVSIGIASYSDHSHTTKQVLKQADQALYQAKRQGRNRCEIYQTEVCDLAV
ncbi:sensor domain-containing diguanylate cyclase [Oceanospirillum beijerinckii]|uniref:sensor domain-containing diguanylate cyclase n=1 Tax=Oceanospirillum beijerinckii TaxID=64976 RepID=UPI0003FFCAB6|nr:sensor domain-containing diguanylate cyclase [Oceanospirillum beijerinckii]